MLIIITVIVGLFSGPPQCALSMFSDNRATLLVSINFTVYLMLMSRAT